MEKGVGVKFLVQKIWSEMGEGNMKEGLKTRFEMGVGTPRFVSQILCLVHSLLSGSSLNTVGSLQTTKPQKNMGKGHCLISTPTKLPGVISRSVTHELL